MHEPIRESGRKEPLKRLSVGKGGLCRLHFTFQTIPHLLIVDALFQKEKRRLLKYYKNHMIDSVAEDHGQTFAHGHDSPVPGTLA